MALLKDKRALIIGTASGIGAATAQLYAADGARLVCADLNAERGKANADALGAPFHRLDIADRSTVAKAW